MSPAPNVNAPGGVPRWPGEKPVTWAQAWRRNRKHLWWLAALLVLGMLNCPRERYDGPSVRDPAADRYQP